MYDELQRRAQEGRPVRVALIGAGKFGSMFLSQARRVAGLHLVGVADLSRAGAVASLERVGWPIEQYGAHSAREALESGATYLTEDAESLISAAPGNGDEQFGVLRQIVAPLSRAWARASVHVLDAASRPFPETRQARVRERSAAPTRCASLRRAAPAKGTSSRTSRRR